MPRLYIVILYPRLLNRIKCDTENLLFRVGDLVCYIVNGGFNLVDKASEESVGVNWLLCLLAFFL